HLPTVVGREKFAAGQEPDTRTTQRLFVGEAQPLFTEDLFCLQRLRVAVVITDGLGHARSLKRPRRQGQPSGAGRARPPKALLTQATGWVTLRISRRRSPPGVRQAKVSPSANPIRAMPIGARIESRPAAASACSG